MDSEDMVFLIYFGFAIFVLCLLGAHGQYWIPDPIEWTQHAKH